MERLRAELEDSHAHLVNSQDEKSLLAKQAAVFESKAATMEDAMAEEKRKGAVAKAQADLRLEEERIRRAAAEERLEEVKAQLEKGAAGQPQGVGKESLARVSSMLDAAKKEKAELLEDNKCRAKQIEDLLAQVEAGKALAADVEEKDKGS